MKKAIFILTGILLMSTAAVVSAEDKKAGEHTTTTTFSCNGAADQTERVVGGAPAVDAKDGEATGATTK